jgi:hypothetical protein
VLAGPPLGEALTLAEPVQDPVAHPRPIEADPMRLAFLSVDLCPRPASLDLEVHPTLGQYLAAELALAALEMGSAALV